MRKMYLSGLVVIMLLTACSEVSDYELRLVENDNKFTVSTSNSSADPTIYSYVIDNSQTIELYLDDEEGFAQNDEDVNEQTDQNSENTADYTEGLHDSIVVEEDIVQADIQASTEAESDEFVFEETQQVEEVEEVEEVPETTETTIEDETVVEEDDQEVQVEVQEEVQVEAQEEAQEEVQEEVLVQVYPCIHLEQEHIFTQSLIDYVGKGNYAKWEANDVSTCEAGLSIYDYMSYFNMTKGFFTNITANETTYKDLDLYAYEN